MDSTGRFGSNPRSTKRKSDRGPDADEAGAGGLTLETVEGDMATFIATRSIKPLESQFA